MAAEKIKKNKSKQLTKITPKQHTIITLKKQNPTMSSNKIAKLANADTSYTIEVLQRYGLIEQYIGDYKTHRADILAGLQHRLVSSITQEDIKKAPMGSRVLAAAQLYDKERLERNQSTANIATAHGITPEMQELYDRITQKAKVEGQVIEVKPEAQITE